MYPLFFQTPNNFFQPCQQQLRRRFPVIYGIHRQIFPAQDGSRPDGKIDLPLNMWFIGTANNDDSTFAISDKVYDRAMVMNLDEKAEEFYVGTQRPLHLTAERFKELGRQAEREYKMTRRNRKRLEELDNYMKETFRVTFGNRILRQIRAYVAIYVGCGGDELAALDDILAKKVMRKLGVQNPIHLRNQADKFCRFMDDLFGEDGMVQCKATMRRLQLTA